MLTQDLAVISQELHEHKAGHNKLKLYKKYKHYVYIAFKY